MGNVTKAHVARSWLNRRLCLSCTAEGGFYRPEIKCTALKDQLRKYIALAVGCAGVGTNLPEDLPFPCPISPSWGHRILICMGLNSGLGPCCPCPGFREVAWSLARQ